jgi:alpha-beta hydrolase superfamily lysophospholipase
VLAGSDTGAALLAALIGTGFAAAPVVLAGLPGHDRQHLGGCEDELDARSHGPVHRGVRTDDAAVTRGALSTAAPADLLDAAYRSASAVPHLLSTGEADAIADREALARLAKSLPAARLATVRGACRDVLNDVSHRSVAAELVSFLEAASDGVPPRPFVRTGPSAW